MLLDSCGDHPTYQLSEADQSGETKELNGEVHRELALTFNGGNVTVECVARSKMGESRVQYYVPGKALVQYCIKQLYNTTVKYLLL